jgi:hypothetical protein
MDYCGARTKHREGTCRQPPVPGGATRCHWHGGHNQIYSKGDPRRGGQPLKNGLYAKHLHSKPELMASYEDAVTHLGSVDRELSIARTLADWAVAQWAKDPHGGVPINYTRREDKGTSRDIVRIRLWSEIASEHLDRVRKLELSRAVIISVGKNTGVSSDVPYVARLADGRVVPAPFVSLPGGTSH